MKSVKKFREQIIRIMENHPHANWLVEFFHRNGSFGIPAFYFLHKYGRFEIQNLRRNQASKHIEFIGLNGSGKSTLFRKANLYLKSNLGYQPGPSMTWMEILKDERVSYPRNYQYKLLEQFILNNKDFISWVIQKAISHDLDWLEKINRDFQLQYLLAICTFYQTRFRKNYSVWTMLDEGFYENLFWFTADSNHIIQPGLVKELVSEAPTVDLLFYIKTDIDTCIERLNLRKNGIPRPYRGYNEKEFLKYLKVQDDLIAGFIKNIPTKSTTIIEINNNQSLDESFPSITHALDTLMKYSKS